MEEAALEATLPSSWGNPFRLHQPAWDKFFQQTEWVNLRPDRPTSSNGSVKGKRVIRPPKVFGRWLPPRALPPSCYWRFAWRRVRISPTSRPEPLCQRFRPALKRRRSGAPSQFDHCWDWPQGALWGTQFRQSYWQDCLFELLRGTAFKR